MGRHLQAGLYYGQPRPKFWLYPSRAIQPWTKCIPSFFTCNNYGNPCRAAAQHIQDLLQSTPQMLVCPLCLLVSNTLFLYRRLDVEPWVLPMQFFVFGMSNTLVGCKMKLLLYHTKSQKDRKALTTRKLSAYLKL